MSLAVADATVDIAVSRKAGTDEFTSRRYRERYRAQRKTLANGPVSFTRSTLQRCCSSAGEDHPPEIKLVRCITLRPELHQRNPVAGAVDS
jgi:hypothetical protein